MPTDKVSMREIKEILKLNHENVSNREIARRLRGMTIIGTKRYSKPTFRTFVFFAKT